MHWSRHLMRYIHLQMAKPLNESPEAAHTAAVVNALSDALRAALEDRIPINAQRVAEGKGPANCVLLRGCGSRCSV